MSNNITYVQGDQLTALANSLKSKGDSILNEYKGNCAQALEMSAECLQISGLNTTEFFQALEKIYTNLNQRVTEVSDFLTNVVVAEYQMVNDAVVNNFNSGFASQMSSILGITMGGGFSAINPTLPGTPNPNPAPDLDGGAIPKQPGGRETVEIPPQPKDNSIPKQMESEEHYETTDAQTENANVKENETTDSQSSGTGVESAGAKTLPAKSTNNEGNSSAKAVYFDDESSSSTGANTQTEPTNISDTNEATGTGSMTRAEGNSSPTPVYLDDSGKAVAASTKPSLPEADASAGDVSSVSTPTSNSMSRAEGNSSATAVYLDDSGNAVAASAKPSLPESKITSSDIGSTSTPTSGSMSRAEGNSSATAVYLDDSGTSVAASTKPSLPESKITSTNSSSTTSGKDFSALGIKPLETKTTSSRSGGYYAGGGGGGTGASAITFTNDVLTKPFRVR